MKKNDKQEELTLAELKRKFDHIERATRLPTAKTLQNGKRPVIASKTMMDGSLLQVFENGYVLYKTSRFYTVFPVNQCGDYTYHFRTDTLYLSADYFDDKPWALRLQMEAERRIVHNQETYEEDAAKGARILYAAFQEQNNAEQDFANGVLKKNEAIEILAQLSDKQRKVFLKRYYLGYSMTQIAQELKVSCSAVSQMLSTAEKKIKKILNTP